MDNKIHEDLIKNTEEIRQLISLFPTEAIVYACANDSLFHSFQNETSKKINLSWKQRFFLLGLMLATPEPKESKDLKNDDWKKLAELLENIFNCYAFMFWPKSNEYKNLPKEWYKVREVAMPAFLHYFSNGPLLSVEQISEQIRLYLFPFDNNLGISLGISISETLKIADFISNSLQGQINNLNEAMDKEITVRCSLLNEAKSKSWSKSKIMEEVCKDKYFPYYEKMMLGLKGLYRVELSTLKEKFGDNIAISYWNQFVARRGEVENFVYLTERNIAEEKPLYEIKDGIAMCSLANSLHYSILLVGEKSLISGATRDSFFRRRDKILENQIKQKIMNFLGENASYFSTIYETPLLQYEHDLIVLCGKKLFIIEAKASPQVEPFRDPEKAYIRIKDAFHSDKGIQKAYEQANHLRKQLINNKKIELYDSDRKCLTTIRLEAVDDIYCICVTRDNFGPLAVDLSLLLQKENTDSYPWVVNVYDLEYLLDAWNYFSWGVEKLCEYLDLRIELNGKVLSFDEMEITGFFIQHGGLQYLTNIKGDKVFIPPFYSDVLDKIYDAKYCNGEKVIYKPTVPIMEDMQKMMYDMINKKKDQAENYIKKKIGRNDPCFCGSGKKYKHCCLLQETL